MIDAPARARDRPVGRFDRRAVLLIVVVFAAAFVVAQGCQKSQVRITKEQAIAFKPDPAFPDFKDPFRPQVITVKFWSKSDPKDQSPRTEWLRKAKASFDFAALAALLR